MIMVYNKVWYKRYKKLKNNIASLLPVCKVYLGSLDVLHYHQLIKRNQSAGESGR